MIRVIDNIQFKRFLIHNKALSKQVAINLKGIHYAYFLNDEILGVVSILDTKNTRRVKGFLVRDDCQKKGIGTMLLKSVLNTEKKITAFATCKSLKLFLSLGFIVKNKLKNNIKFLEK